MERLKAGLLAVVFAVVVTGSILLLTSTGGQQQTQPQPKTSSTKPDADEPKVPKQTEPEVRPQPPAYVPPPVHTPALADFVNRESKEHRVTGDIHVRLPKVSHPDDIKAVVAVLLDTKDGDTVRHEAANLLRRSNYPGLTADLLTVLHNPEEKERFRSFVAQHLWSQARDSEGERPKIVGELHGCLNDRHTAVRREALLALVRLNDPKGVETALKWFAEAKPETEGVLDLCVRVIREQDLREHLPAIRKLITSPNESAARQAMVTVGHWGDQESRPLLEEAAKSSRPLVKRAAEAALKKLDAAKVAAPVKEGSKPKQAPKGKTRF